MFTVDLDSVFSYKTKLDTSTLLGILGEEVIFKYLEAKYADQADIIVTRTNLKRETGFPYDVQVQRRTSNGDLETLEYAEVKVTETEDPPQVCVSRNEWDKAVEEGEKFNLYQIHSVPINPMTEYVGFKIVKIEDPAKMVAEGRLTRTVVVRKQY